MSISTSLGDALIWYGVVSGLALLLYPILFHAASRLPDRGISLARPLGLLLAVVGPWWLSAVGLVPFTNALLVAVPLAIGLTGWAFELRRGELISEIRVRWRTLVLIEAVCLALFLGYVVFRGFNPAALYTEKPMDMALLNSAIHTHSMPPPDPWFAGKSVNYYYLGYLLMAVVARLSGTAPGVAFNLSLATLFATAVIAAAGTAANIVRVRARRKEGRWQPIIAGALGALFLVGIGNLVAILDFLHHPRTTLAAGWWEGVGWNASRVIVDHGVPASSGPHPTINEFPAFTFVLGDLHPHVLAFPIFLSTIGLAVSIMSCKEEPAAPYARADRALGLLVAGTTIGALYAINSWDMPTALAVAVGALVLSTGLRCLRDAVRPLAMLVGAALITALPFALDYTPSVGGNTTGIPAGIQSLPVVGSIARTIGVVTWSRSGFEPLLKIYGLYLAIALLLIGALWALTPRALRPDLRLVALATAGALLIAVALHFAALLLFGLPLAVLIMLLMNARADQRLRFAGGLVAFAMALVIIPELFYLQDAFGDRMNTVFKVYFQAWGILAIGSGATLALIAPLLAKFVSRVRLVPIAGLLGLLILGSGLYPPLSAYRWSNGFRHWQGINGLAYLAQSGPAELAAIDWLNRHEQPGDVVLEAPGCSYGFTDGLPHDRVSMATGIPTVIGWNFHEYQWRDGIPADLAAIQTRENDVNEIYEHPTSARAKALLNQYNVTYIYVGALERDGYGPSCTLGPPYPASSLDQLASIGWPVAFQHGDVTIYRRPIGEGTASAN